MTADLGQFDGEQKPSCRLCAAPLVNSLPFPRLINSPGMSDRACIPGAIWGHSTAPPRGEGGVHQIHLEIQLWLDTDSRKGLAPLCVLQLGLSSAWDRTCHLPEKESLSLGLVLAALLQVLPARLQSNNSKRVWLMIAFELL